MDFVNEFIVRRNRTGNDYLMMAGYLILGVILTLLGLNFAPFLGSMFLLPVAGIWYGVYYLISLSNIEFEYTMVNGELDVDKIIARKRRKRVISVKSSDFELFAPHKPEITAHQKQNGVTILDCSGVRSGDAYYALYSKDGKRTMLIFNPTDKMLDDIQRHVPRTLFTR